jgi:hypothetical protein
LTSIEAKSFRWHVESVLVVEDTLFKAMESILVSLVGDDGVSLTVSDGL